jgi:isopentenyl diphosphate isomerase/L-lactate dehydrogenase-like FMN-dependent dehydrogenase
MWGTAVGGQAGTAHAISMLYDEIDRVMAFLGKSAIPDLDSSTLVQNAWV